MRERERERERKRKKERERERKRKRGGRYKGIHTLFVRYFTFSDSSRSNI